MEGLQPQAQSQYGSNCNNIHITTAFTWRRVKISFHIRLENNHIRKPHFKLTDRTKSYSWFPENQSLSIISSRTPQASLRSSLSPSLSSQIHDKAHTATGFVQYVHRNAHYCVSIMGVMWGLIWCWHAHSFSPSDINAKAVHISLTFSCWGKQLFDSCVDGTS